MKCSAAILFLSLQLAGSAFAALATSHTELEDVVKQRQRSLRKKTPLNRKDKVLLKRLLSEKTLRYAKDISDDEPDMRPQAGSDPLSNAIRENALAKIEENSKAKEKKEAKRKRKLQQYAHGPGNYYNQQNNYYGGYYGNYYGQPQPQQQQQQQQQQQVYTPPIPQADIPEKVSMVLEAFQDSRNIQDPLLVTSRSSFLTAGTEYLFNNEPLFNVVFDTPPGANRPTFLVNTRDRIAVVSGTCTRTDPKINYVGRSYCQLEYRFLDRENNVEATIMAEGPVTKGDINTLSITGGSGIFRRTVGTVVLESGRLRNGSPPVYIPDDSLDLPASYIVKMFVFMDSIDLELL